MNTIKFQRFGPMIDCSRNAVVNMDSMKKWMDICADLGCTAFYPYIEDVYELDDNPYFGYARGRYTKAELKEMDAYGRSKGLEVIPCIQTLAHLNSIFRWSVYREVHDCEDILLIGEEKTYQLIDKMFSVMHECFTTRNINIGMDEAHMVGKGQYYDIHGDADQHELILQHLERVAALAEKYGYTAWMWSDMFFRYGARNRDYYRPYVELSQESKARIPQNVRLIYWDYYHTDKAFYDSMIAAHEKIREGTVFAGVLGACQGLAPCNVQKLTNNRAGIQSCLDNGIQDVILTTWGDDGGENARFCNLPTLYYAAQQAKGITDMKTIRQGFREMFGIPFDAFMALELVDGDRYTTDSKNLLYNDVFLGLLDSTIAPGRGEKYAQAARKLAGYREHPQWGYLFRTAHALCRVLILKAEIGKHLRSAYQAGDKEALRALLPQLKEIRKRLDIFHRCYREQWYKENKSFGFEIQDLRIGGLMRRVETCTQVLSDYLDGKLARIEELEQPLLDFHGEGAVEKHRTFTAIYKNIVSANQIC